MTHFHDWRSSRHGADGRALWCRLATDWIDSRLSVVWNLGENVICVTEDSEEFTNHIALLDLKLVERTVNIFHFICKDECARYGVYRLIVRVV